MKLFIIAILLVAYSIQAAYSQVNEIYGFAKTGILAGSGGSIPFWMITNEYGRFTPRSENAWLDAGIFSDTIALTRKIKTDLGAEVFGRQDGEYRVWLQQGYAGVKVSFLYFYAGWKEEHFGSQDPELSSGFVMWSGNARPLPKLSLSTVDFVRVPFTKGFVEFKAGFAHGWFGNNGYVKNSYLHHTYLYLKFGGSHALHITAGMHHFAEWAGISPEYGQMPSGFENFIKVFLAHEGKDTVSGVPYDEWANRYGNHLGTKDISVDYRFKGGLKVKAYWQNFIEDVTGLGFRNVSDGLWGIQVEKPENFKFGYEFFRSITNKYGMKDGSLEGGTDSYFNNGVYRSGWTYKEYTIGNPLITSPVLIHSEYPEIITNNRVVGHIVSLIYYLNQNIFNLRYSFTENYGGKYVLFVPSKIQHCFLVSWKKSFSDDKIYGKLSFGLDKGDLLGDHFGFGLEVGIAL